MSKKSEKTKRMILEKTAALFNQRGFAGTSMQDIMEVTGLTKGGLYGNFKSKEEIAVAAFDYAVSLVKKRVAKRTHVIENSLDKLKAVVYFYKETLLNSPVEGGCPIMNTSIESDDNNPALRERVIEALDYWQSRLVWTVENGIERGEINPKADARHFASLFISTLEGGLMLSRIYKSEEPFNRVAKQLLRMIDELKL